jgi:hypothetical protein
MVIAWKYMPILKWKQGEQIALRGLTVAQWEPVVPLLELLAIRAAPDGASLRNALPDYLAKVAQQIAKNIPEDKPIAIDLRHVAPAYGLQARFLKVVCTQLSKLTARVILPVISDLVLSQSSREFTHLLGFDEYVVRLHSPGLVADQIAGLIEQLRVTGIPKTGMHLVVDQHSIVKEDASARAIAIRPYLEVALACKCRSTALAGGSFPVNLIGLKQGVHDIQRVEWKIWELIKMQPQFSNVRYSDYAVTNPAPIPDMDPLQVNPSVSIRYAANGYWRLFKAGGFKKGKPNQYRALCKLLLTDSVYSGSAFSFGDKCYADAAQAKLGNGNPSSWRRDATSHHLVLTSSML